VALGGGGGLGVRVLGGAEVLCGAVVARRLGLGAALMRGWGEKGVCGAV